jgi:hypothetical protein
MSDKIMSQSFPEFNKQQWLWLNTIIWYTGLLTLLAIEITSHDAVWHAFKTSRDKHMYEPLARKKN